MRRLAVIALILAAAAAVAATAYGSLPRIPKSKASVRVKSCSLDDRSAVFYGRMRKLRRTRRMRMRFSLLERAPNTSRFKNVHAPGLSHWRKSAVGVRAYGYSQQVKGLNYGSTYRMRVRYRWYDKKNHFQRGTHRTSKSCRMFEPQANLRVQLLGTRGLGGGKWRYNVRVRNVGELAAGGVKVQLTVDGTIRGTQVVPALEPADSVRLSFDAPACKSHYSFHVDPDGTVPESNEGDNRAGADC
jgi:hypothetical protein